jgi:hypothetical protein
MAREREVIRELHFIGTTHHCGDGVWAAARAALLEARSASALLLPQLVHAPFICNAPLFRRVGAHSRSSLMAKKHKSTQKKSKGM